MADPRTAFLITIDPAHEGGYQNIHNDRGNWTRGEIGLGEAKGTKYGISAAQFPELDIKNLTPEQAIDIYTKQYWPVLYSEIESQPLANKLADLGVLFGQKTAVTLLQHTLSIEPMDGDFGPQTLKIVNAHDPASMLQAYKTNFVAHAMQVGANNPDERRFVSDWIRRINS